MSSILFFLKTPKKRIDRSIALLIVSIMIIQTSCKKLTDVDPPVTSTTGASVYTLDATAIAVLTGMYTNINKGNFATGSSSISLLSGLSADEFKLSNTVSSTSNHYFYYTNALFSNPSGNPGTENWGPFYNYIFTCNDVIEQLNKSTSLTAAVKQQLLGEAKFMRAFLYFYLVNLYGNVPVAITTDYEINSRLARAPVSDVYQQIITDLLEAKNLLSDRYLAADMITSTSARVRPTKWSAGALLARAYLYTGDNAKAETEATTVINNLSLYNLVPLNNVFLANSMEAIWQLQPVNTGWNTEDAQVFVINAAPSPSKPITISQNLSNSFELGDARKINWIKDTVINTVNYPYPYKYKSAKQNDPVTEYLMVLRLGEQYLIRAEARAKLNNVTGAQSDLNMIRTRAGLPSTTASTQTTLLTAILNERQHELFSEWGHRWFDLKRTNNVNSVMSLVTPQKGGIWNTNWQLYPIPLSDLQRNPNLQQNAGY